MAKQYYIKKHVITEQPVDVIPGPETIATSLCTMIQDSIDSGCVSGLATNQDRILTDNLTTVDANYVGTAPTAVVTGTDDEIVTITIPSGCTPRYFIVIGDASYVNGNDERTVIFEGDGVPGNTGLDYLNPPAIEKVKMPTTIGVPSSGNPYAYDLDSSPGYEIISVGTTSAPSIGIRFTNMSGLQNKHLLRFQW